MPAPRSRCSKPECKKFQPCSEHPRGWASSKSPALPSNWVSLRKKARGFDTKRCYLCGTIDPGGSVDHIVPRSKGGTDALENLAWICKPHHDQKTQEESKEGNRRR